MKNTKVAVRYAKALLDLMIERNGVDAAYSDMSLVADTIGASHDLKSMLTSPVISKGDKLNAVDAIFGKHISSDTAAYLRIIVNKGREQHLFEIATAFVALVKKHRNILTAVLTTATPADEQILAKVRGIISAVHSGGIEIEQQVSPEAIGGFLLRVDDHMIDASISAKLHELRQEFLKNPYVAGF